MEEYLYVENIYCRSRLADLCRSRERERERGTRGNPLKTFLWHTRGALGLFFGTRGVIFFLRSDLNKRKQTMSISRSSNCSRYTDTLSVLVDGRVSITGREDVCSVWPPPSRAKNLPSKDQTR